MCDAADYAQLTSTKETLNYKHSIDNFIVDQVSMTKL